MNIHTYIREMEVNISDGDDEDINAGFDSAGVWDRGIRRTKHNERERERQGKWTQGNNTINEEVKINWLRATHKIPSRPAAWEQVGFKEWGGNDAYIEVAAWHCLGNRQSTVDWPILPLALFIHSNRFRIFPVLRITLMLCEAVW